MSKATYGGQAVIEGVMMAGPKGKAIAVRNEDGEIVYKIEDKPRLSEKHPQLKLPVLRGVASFVMSMISGVKDLTWSAAQAGETEDDKLSAWDIVVAVAGAFIFAVLFFVALPVFVGTYVHPYVGDFGRSLTEGILRLALFLGYVLAISRMNDIKRLFAYHGAEHKTINAFEAGAELTPEAVRHYSRIHTRCGTSFILMAMLLMIVVFTFVGQTDTWHRILIKILLMPLIAGLSYELFRLPVKHPRNVLIKILVAPGLAMQRLTTREPDAGMLEVAISALKAVPGFAGAAAAEAAETGRIRGSVHTVWSQAAADQPTLVFPEAAALAGEGAAFDQEATFVEPGLVLTPSEAAKPESGAAAEPSSSARPGREAAAVLAAFWQRCLKGLKMSWEALRRKLRAWREQRLRERAAAAQGQAEPPGRQEQAAAQPATADRVFDGPGERAASLTEPETAPGPIVAEVMDAAPARQPGEEADDAPLPSEILAKQFREATEKLRLDTAVVPGIGEPPAIGEAPATEEAPAAEEVPATEESPAAEQPAGLEQKPAPPVVKGVQTGPGKQPGATRNKQGGGRQGKPGADRPRQGGDRQGKPGADRARQGGPGQGRKAPAGQGKNPAGPRKQSPQKEENN